MNLPNELLSKIFEYLGPVDVSRACRCCRFWYSAANAQFWRNVAVTDLNLPFLCRSLLTSARREALEGLQLLHLDKTETEQLEQFLFKTQSLLPALDEACAQSITKGLLEKEPSSDHHRPVNQDPQLPDVQSAAAIFNAPGPVLEAIQALMAGHPRAGDNDENADLETLLEHISANVDIDQQPFSRKAPVAHFNRRWLGWGKLIRELQIPSDGEFTMLLEHVHLLLPALKRYTPFHEQLTIQAEILSSAS